MADLRAKSLTIVLVSSTDALSTTTISRLAPAGVSIPSRAWSVFAKDGARFRVQTITDTDEETTER